MSPKEEPEGTPLTKSEMGKLGGLRAAANMTQRQRQARSRKGGSKVSEERGREFYVRLAMRRWGKKVAISGPKSKADPEMENSQNDDLTGGKL